MGTPSGFSLIGCFLQLELTALLSQLAGCTAERCATISASTSFDTVSSTDVSTGHHLHNPAESTAGNAAMEHASAVAASTMVRVRITLAKQMLVAIFDLAINDARTEPSDETSSAISKTVAEPIAPVTFTILERQTLDVAITTANRHLRGTHWLLRHCRGRW